MGNPRALYYALRRKRTPFGMAEIVRGGGAQRLRITCREHAPRVTPRPPLDREALRRIADHYTAQAYEQGLPLDFVRDIVTRRAR